MPSKPEVATFEGRIVIDGLRVDDLHATVGPRGKVEFELNDAKGSIVATISPKDAEALCQGLANELGWSVSKVGQKESVYAVPRCPMCRVPSKGGRMCESCQESVSK